MIIVAVLGRNWTLFHYHIWSAVTQNFRWDGTQCIDAWIPDSSMQCVWNLHCKNRLVVLTAEWLPRLHGLLWYQRLLYKNQFPCCFLLFPRSEIRKEERKQQGNYLLACFIQLASDAKISHATKITTLWLKQPICFYSVPLTEVLRYSTLNMVMLSKYTISLFGPPKQSLFKSHGVIHTWHWT